MDLISQKLMECIAICQKLESYTESDKDLIRQSLGGEIEKIYCEACDKSNSQVKSVKAQLIQLRQEISNRTVI